jgi:large subunit ribosomal protein L9
MKVILLRDVKRLGRRHEVKEVSDGYAANFLLPKKLAAPATNEALAKQEQLIEQERKTRTEREALKIRIESEPIEIEAVKGARGEVFKGVSARDIERALRAKGLAGNYAVELDRPIKSVGEHDAVCNMGGGVRARVTVIVR